MSRPPFPLSILDVAKSLAADFLKTLRARPVHATADVEALRRTLSIELTDDGVDAETVLRELAENADAGLMGSAGPRYFGFVIGGSLPAALGADWMVSTWDQNAGIFATSPAISVIEETAGKWLIELLRLPPDVSFGFVTGAQLANFTCLAAARNAVLQRAGWNVEDDGLQAAPRVHVVVSEESHVTVFAALRMLGFGTAAAIGVKTDGQGRMDPGELEKVLAPLDGPIILCTQAGNVNSGSIDPLDQIVPIARRKEAWVHVDSAFGLWAAASDRLRTHVKGIADADSWAMDAHKWLNVPYDCGVAFVRDRLAHHSAFSVKASYLEQTEGAERDAIEWVPEFSRRGRAVPVYAALRSLGRKGVTDLIERCCEYATLFASILREVDGVEVLNDVVLNQVLVRFGDSDEATWNVIHRVQNDGILWLGGTTWHGRAAMRISVSNWSTTEEDVRLSAAAITSAWLTGSAESSEDRPTK